ncbi:MAG: DUF2784 domain-containing protein [marine benthic group bacterium]|nr:DUF2784 domain-containing protein [Gemmatimonadota bacterium]
MGWSLAADLVMLAHFSFAAFASLGGLMVLLKPRLAWLHLPVLIYAIGIELVGWICPLTPLEWNLRARAGEAGFEGGFLERYLDPILYPADWDRLHIWLGILLLLFNLAVYSGVWIRHVRRPGSGMPTEPGGPPPA